MLARLTTAALCGVDAIPVSVEVDVSGGGLPGVTIVGLPDATVRESRERVRSAIRNSGFPFPSGHVTVSLAPADVRKVGAAFDLPIALGILAASGILPYRDAPPMVIVGGLSLDGAVPHMQGLLPIAVSARRAGPETALMFPGRNIQEAGIVADIRLHPVDHLLDAARVYCSPSPAPAIPPACHLEPDSTVEDLVEVCGQIIGRRALEVTAAGAHHLLLCGPPGAGKTMLARRLPGILPPMTFDDALAVTTIHSVAGLLPLGAGLVMRRPFRAPHHTCSDVALVGGGTFPRPGEMSLAHRGVLFLDELPEFSRRVLEALRQPLELGEVHVARASRSLVFPASVTLVGAMNPCPCGYLGDQRTACRCPTGAIERYQRRLSGPLRDRFDLSVALQGVPWSEIDSPEPRETSAEVRARVVAARQRQLERQGMLNAQVDGRALRRICGLASRDKATLGRAVSRLGLSVRGVTRVLRVARTVADLAGTDTVEERHLAEALLFRGVGK